MVLIQARWALCLALHTEGGLPHDFGHLLEQNPVLPVDLRVAFLEHLLPLQVVPDVIKLVDFWLLRVDGRLHAPNLLPMELMLPLLPALRADFVSNWNGPIHRENLHFLHTQVWDGWVVIGWCKPLFGVKPPF